MAVRALPFSRPAPNSARWIPASVLTLTDAALIAVGFFLPWLHGDGIFAMRTFSGFGLAGALHNVTAGMAVSHAGSLAPMLLYALPAGAVGVALFGALSGGRPARALSLLFGVYVLVVVSAVLALALLTDGSRLLGPPSWGLGLTAVGALLLLAGGLVAAGGDEAA